MFKSNEDPLVVKLQFLMFSLEYSLYHSPKRKKKKKKKKKNVSCIENHKKKKQCEIKDKIRPYFGQRAQDRTDKYFRLH